MREAGGAEPDGEFGEKSSEDRLFDHWHDDKNERAVRQKREVPACHLSDEVDVLLLLELDPTPARDELGEIAKADGRNSDHRPGFQCELKFCHLCLEAPRPRRAAVRG